MWYPNEISRKVWKILFNRNRGSERKHRRSIEEENFTEIIIQSYHKNPKVWNPIKQLNKILRARWNPKSLKRPATEATTTKPKDKTATKPLTKTTKVVDIKLFKQGIVSEIKESIVTDIMNNFDQKFGPLLANQQNSNNSSRASNSPGSISELSLFAPSTVDGGRKRPASADNMSDLFPSPKVAKTTENGTVAKTTKQVDNTDDRVANTDDLNLAADMLAEVVKDMPDDEEYGESIHDGLAKRFKKQFEEVSQAGEIRSELCKEYKTPENCKFLKPPKMNSTIWDMKSFTDSYKKNEKKLYSSQKFISKASCCLTRIANLTLKAENEMVDNKAIIRSCLDAMTLLGFASHEINLKRKQNAKYSLKHDVRDICKSTKVVTSEYLFGDDLTTDIKEARQTSKIAVTSSSTITSSKDKNHNKYDRANPASSSSSARGNRFFHKAKNPAQPHQTSRRFKKSN